MIKGELTPQIVIAGLASMFLLGCASPDVAEIQRTAQSGQYSNAPQSGWDRQVTTTVGTVAGAAAASQVTKQTYSVGFIRKANAN